MRCPTISELPAPPDGKTGWPWDGEVSSSSEVWLDEADSPRVSITTPSYNQAPFLEETIRSVLLQGYPNLEYMILDGGSTDGSVEIIRKYEPWLSYWVSEADNGQSAAINNGWSRSTGQVIAWLNSDDTYEADALRRVAHFFSENSHIDMVYGDCRIVDERGQFITMAPKREFDLGALMRGEWLVSQPSTFLRKSVVDRIGLLNEDLHMVMDWEYWLRVGLTGHTAKYLPKSLASFRSWENAKSSSRIEESREEQITVLDKIFMAPSLPDDVNKLRNESYRGIHWQAVKAYRKGKRPRQELYHLMKFFRYHPRSIVKWRLLKRLLTCVTGTFRLRTIGPSPR